MSLTPTEFIRLVTQSDDWHKLQNELVSFRESPNRGEAVEPLLELLHDSDETTRARAVTALAQIKGPESKVIPAVLPLLEDPATNVQWHAANLFGELSEQPGAGSKALSEKMMQDDCEIATFAAVTANKLDPNLDIGTRLVELTMSPIRKNRWRAVMHLRDHVDVETAKSHLTKIFGNETDEEIRNLIADSLNEL